MRCVHVCAARPLLQRGGSCDLLHYPPPFALSSPPRRPGRERGIHCSLSFQQDRDTWGDLLREEEEEELGRGVSLEEETLDERKYFEYNSRHTCLRRLCSTTPAAKQNLIERSPVMAKFVCLSVFAHTPLLPYLPLFALSVWGKEWRTKDSSKKEGYWKNLRQAILGSSRGKTAGREIRPRRSVSVGPTRPAVLVSSQHGPRERVWGRRYIGWRKSIFIRFSLCV